MRVAPDRAELDVMVLKIAYFSFTECDEAKILTARVKVDAVVGITHLSQTDVAKTRKITFHCERHKENVAN